jgi:hypothetical protein
MLSIDDDAKRTIATYTPVPLVVMKDSFEKEKRIYMYTRRKEKKKKKIIIKKPYWNIHYHLYNLKFDWPKIFNNSIFVAKFIILMNKIYPIVFE